MKLSKDYNLLVLNPVLAAQWHSTKNGTLKPNEVTVGSDKKIWWQCTKDADHVWDASVSHRTNGRGCPECAKNFPLSLDDMHKLAEKRGGKCLSNEYINTSTKYKWECSLGHRWSNSFNKIKAGRWCKKCNKAKQRRLLEKKWLAKCETYAISLGGLCLGKSENSKNVKDIKYKFRCRLKHEWNTSGTSVIYQKSWCPECAGNLKLSLDDMHKLAEKRGGKCLSNEYINTDTNYDWECSLGHRWSNSFNKIKTGQWCSICRKSGISEEVCRTTFEEIFKESFSKYRPKWLKNSLGFQMELDGYCKKLQIAFEYQGIQHFEKTFYQNSTKALEKRKKDDERKVNLCRENGVKLFVIDYRVEFFDFQKVIKKQATEFGMDISKYDFNSQIDLNQAYIREDRILELKKIIEAKNGRLLSDKWLDVKKKYRVRCKNNHEWEAAGTELLGGSWCKTCHMNKLKEQHIGSIDDVIDFARQYEGELLTKTYLMAAGNYSFKCKNGHKFSGKLSNLKFRNQWCPTCEGRMRRGPWASYDEILPFIHSLNLKSVKHWKLYIQGKLEGYEPLPTNIPKDPDRVYKKQGCWSGWGAWLGTDAVAYQDRKYLPYKDAKVFVHELNLRSQEEWRRYLKGEFSNLPKLPSNIPHSPYSVYYNSGWENWKKWLGKN